MSSTINKRINAAQLKIDIRDTIKRQQELSKFYTLRVRVGESLQIAVFHSLSSSEEQTTDGPEMNHSTIRTDVIYPDVVTLTSDIEMVKEGEETAPYAVTFMKCSASGRSGVSIIYINEIKIVIYVDPKKKKKKLFSSMFAKSSKENEEYDVQSYFNVDVQHLVNPSS
jgi:hypothetical protein